MNSILKEIGKIGIVPVVVLQDPKEAEPLAGALCRGGIPCAEVTFRTDAAEESIRIISEKYPEMLVGAGTVLTTEQVDRAVAAGAKFIVSPGLNPDVASYCIEKDVPIVPGCATPSEVEKAVGLGLEVVKFFPAEAAGGLNMIKSMAAPYTKMKFMPTGGINAKNLNQYLAFDKIVACGGSWMVSGDLVKAGAFDQIEALSAEAMQNMLGFELKHVGINAPNVGEANGIADQFTNAFGFAKKEGNSSIFAGNLIEVMKEPYLGQMGHIAIGTNSIERAEYFLAKKGFTVQEETRKPATGKTKAIYLTNEFGGFAIHLLQK
ncbi:bifunctional 4-hydroxy-2-oxoglutarate aldolase/2-dehydro-3-deoxy-phosphogluconate aldolase [Chakrabartyella piscis]|uniref:bifunctional 4-hydroxy-2-oxoglutarate aldolase/2-dehydro-3-deoxy-phosphogluconate aldolase n=1 Tax=Chakrabartyella piscis TaxID=2918914 RepID=UPI002958B8B6|nr:bifunctional 4-hydroxy-2-oxoglutarate aldolase/2-dehydro-3-deoxy-phosphogluconate aldolase [Chakrabartyella piscis]